MRVILTLLCTAILISMITVTVMASLDRSIFQAGPVLWQDRWFQATLLDAYCGFLTFYAWVCYKETTVAGRLVWFVLVMVLGNIAMSAYVLWKLWRLPPEAGCRELLLR